MLILYCYFGSLSSLHHPYHHFITVGNLYLSSPNLSTWTIFVIFPFVFLSLSSICNPSSIYLSIYVSVIHHLSIYLSIYTTIIYLSSTYLSLYPSIYLSLQTLLDACTIMGTEAVVEVHTPNELEFALSKGNILMNW